MRHDRQPPGVLKTIGVSLFLLILLTLSACELPAASNEADVLFADNFTTGETGLWLLEGDNLGRSLIRDGQLVIEIDAPQTVQYATLEQPILSNFALEVDATQLGGGLHSSYGILFRVVNPTSFYRFEITGDGSFIVERHDEGGAWQRLAEDWATTPAIQQGLNVANRLKVEAAGNVFTFSINDQVVQQVSDSAYSQGVIALDAGTFAQTGLVVAFDNLTIRVK